MEAQTGSERWRRTLPGDLRRFWPLGNRLLCILAHPHPAMLLDAATGQHLGSMNVPFDCRVVLPCGAGLFLSGPGGGMFVDEGFHVRWTLSQGIVGGLTNASHLVVAKDGSGKELWSANERRFDQDGICSAVYGDAVFQPPSP